MKVLGIDTSTLMTTCAVMDGEQLLGEFSLSLDMSHSEALVPMIKELLENLKLKPEEMDLFSVADGPGSFTGLRIGLATAKSLAHVTGKPIVGVSSLEVLAMGFPYQPLVVPMMDARRDRVFTGIYEMDGFPKTIMNPDAIEVSELTKIIKNLGKKVIAVGDGSVVYREELQEELKDMIIFAPGHLNLSSGSAVCKLGVKKYEEEGSDDLFTMAPDYLRDSQAQRALKEKRQTR
ncbi:MAG: tRNA (adenosine(37)-N6)-threonylcarbamoyltransferase complex dimerization subunit type 1 TsaB [Gudongella sp.]|jgi:tRNA threonylcarbamoyladenosine biosynthesis protein TsaB|nr:tRNA (adenosine(37)-N6)-threonylcarbamoyltransferase complex dimerization subunit type 1 TsaB [Gudongella sp.]